jgi:hypothetical protein
MLGVGAIAGRLLVVQEADGEIKPHKTAAKCNDPIYKQERAIQIDGERRRKDCNIEP